MTTQNVVTSSADGIAAAARKAQSKGPAPVHLWNPPFCGDLDMRIARDGTWYYLGTPIGRFELVKLFSSILRKDDDSFFLVTPAEKVGITVEDAPFVATDFDVNSVKGQQVLKFHTHVGDTATAGPDNPIRVKMDPDTDEPAPYVLIRANLEALIDRKTFYRLVDLGEHQDGWFGVMSSGSFFPIIESDKI